MITASHSRLLPQMEFQYCVEGFFPVIFLSAYFYLKSMAYFIMVPKWLKKLFYRGQAFLIFLSFFPILHLFIYGTSIFFDETNKVETGNFFMNSFSMRLGQTELFPHIILSLSSLLCIVLAIDILIRIRKSSRDTFLILGLWFTILAWGTEMLMLPFTVELFVPVLYLSNFFEAFRMNYLVFREELEESLESEKSESYKEISIDEERVAKLSEQLNQIMQTEKLFRDPNLKLEKLARHLHIPSYLLTQVLRFGLDTNYFEYVSTYRIEDVKKKLEDPKYDSQAVIELAYTAGFNSKSSFNTAFKKITSMTPTQYRKEATTNKNSQ